MKRERRIGFGILSAIVLLGIFIVGVLAAQQAGTLRYTIWFKDAQDLKKGDRVQLAGVDIGRVQYVQLHTQPTRVEVRVRIEPEYAGQIRSDSTAVISSSSFVNVSGQKVVEIINPESGTAEPMRNDAHVEGLDSKVDVVAWRLRRSVGSSEAWRRRLDNLQGLVSDGLEQINAVRTSPQVREALDQLRTFLGQMKEHGAGAVDRLVQEWEPLKQKMQPVIKELSDFGRQYLADQLRQILDQIETTLNEWRDQSPSGSGA